MACDICGKTGERLQSLFEQYATRDVRFICDGCSRIVNHKNTSLMAMVLKMKADLMKRFIAERKAEISTRLKKLADAERARGR